MKFYNQAYLNATDDKQRMKILAGNLPLGTHPDTDDTLFLPQKDRFMGMYVLGVQGTGKSTLIEALVGEDIAAGKSVIVIDPHGDLVDHIAAQLKRDQVPNVSLLDMEDEDYPFGVNLFAGHDLSSSIARSSALDRVLHIFNVLWPDSLKQQHLPRYLRAAAITLLSNPGSTLVDMQRLLQEKRTRRVLLAKVTDTTVLEFWERHDELNEQEQERRIQPLVNRLESLFMGRSLIRNILGQRNNSINFKKAIENKEVLLIKLPLKKLRFDAQLVGTILVNQIAAAVFSFGDMNEKQRPGVSLFVDEFQHFATPDFAELFNEGRKYGSRTLVSHQLRAQLPEQLREPTMSAKTVACFRVTPDDAREMAHFFHTDYTEIREDDIDPHPIKYLLTYPIDDYHVKLLVDRFLRPLQSKRSGGKVKITPNPSVLTSMRGSDITTYEVWDPTLHLDQFLYEVMTTRNPRLPIPWDIVEGFSGCGHGFYNEWRHTLDKEWWLGMELVFPRTMVIERPDGTLEWPRRPDNGKEELYHFLFVLRATMVYLARHPIGTATPVTTSDIAQMLTQLPVGTAFISSSSDCGLVYTLRPEKPVDKQTLPKRLAEIQEQTHTRYCRPKAEVEGTAHPAADADSEPDVPPPPDSLWEDEDGNNG